MIETLDRKNLVTMKLLHYFITEKNYNPIILQGAEDEIWLENLSGDYKIVRIVSNHILNEEQYDFDIYKTKKIVSKIKRKTLSFNLNVLSIFTDIDEDVKLENIKNIDCVSLNDVDDLGKYKFIKDKFPDIDSKTDFKEDGFQLFMKITRDINMKNKEDSDKAAEVFKPKKPIITYGIILINAILFILMVFFGYENYLVENFSVFGYGIVHNHEIYRLITGGFLHVDIMHFVFNMYALYVIGSQVESFMGKWKYIIIYLFSLLAGSLLSVALNTYASIGASGAIFGLLGSLLYFGYHYRVYLGGVLRSQIIPIIILNLAIGFFVSGIDNYSHIGGLVGGILITTGLGVKYKSSNFEKVNGLIVSLLYIMFLLFIAFKYTNYY